MKFDLFQEFFVRPGQSQAEAFGEAFRQGDLAQEVGFTSPTRICLLRAAMALAMGIGDESTDRWGEK